MQASWQEGPVPDHWWVPLGLGPLGSRAVSRGTSRAGCGLRKSLGSLSDDGWGCVPALGGLLAWCISALEPTGCCKRPGLGAKDPSRISASIKSSRRWTLPDMSATGFYDPRESHSCCLPSRPSKPAGNDSYVVTAFALGFGVHKTLCALQEWNLFPPVLWSSCSEAPWAFKAKWSEGSSSWCQTPRWGSLM